MAAMQERTSTEITYQIGFIVRPVRVDAAREGLICTRNHRLRHTDARVRCDGDFPLAPGQPGARLCTPWGSRGAKYCERGSRSLYVTEVLIDMTRLSRVDRFRGALHGFMPS